MDAWGEKYRWTTAFLVFEIAWENRIMTAPRIFCEMGQQLAERAEQMEETVMLSGVEKKANPKLDVLLCNEKIGEDLILLR